MGVGTPKTAGAAAMEISTFFAAFSLSWALFLLSLIQNNKLTVINNTAAAEAILSL
ncbi:hypothetical protein D9M68_435790 [compost metagenome]